MVLHTTSTIILKITDNSGCQGLELMQATCQWIPEGYIVGNLT